ncbi:hypothetical protein JCM16303_006945 [Sporobolomyces ruberrimus]
MPTVKHPSSSRFHSPHPHLQYIEPETIHSVATLTALLTLASLARGFVYTVHVGKDSSTGQIGTGFEPSRIVTNAGILGDRVRFTFLEGIHRVVESDFSRPCRPNGWVSSVYNVPAGTAEEDAPFADYSLDDKIKPRYFSDITEHGEVSCHLGAVFCINTDESNNSTSCQAFQDAARARGVENGILKNSTSTAALIPSTTSSPAAGYTNGDPALRSQTATGTTGAPTQSQGGSSGAGQLAIGAGGLLAATIGVFGAIAA